MSRLLIPLDPAGSASLQIQIRSFILQAIADGTLPPGTRLPSSRDLAAELHVSRNTVTLALQQLLCEGHLQSRERSGMFVATDAPPPPPPVGPAAPASQPYPGLWTHRFRAQPAEPAFRVPPNWQQYPHPFIDGHFDASLFPVAEWREVTRAVLARREVGLWATSTDDADDKLLIEQIRTKILPRRGMRAGADEILITLGAQQGLSLVCALLLQPGVTLAREEPGHPDMPALAAQHGARLHPQPLDQDGMIIDARLAGCGLIHVTPDCQLPTGATLSLDRRRALLTLAAAQDAVVIEEDGEDPAHYPDRALPALRSLPGGERVIYVAELARILSPGLRLGFVVAAPEVIAALRSLRRLSMRAVPMAGQRGVAFFLALGHYDAAMSRLSRIMKARRIALRDALNHYLPHAISTSPVRHGSTVWVRAEGHVDAARLARRAAERGILIEPAAHYFASGQDPSGSFRMGVGCVAVERIRPGVQALADLLRSDLGVPAPAHLAEGGALALKGAALREAMQGARLLYRTVYGDPCTIDLLADGTMHGTAGYANEDQDQGTWWVEEDAWCRRWNNWAYGETARFRTVVADGLVAWFRDNKLVDWAVYVAPAET